MEQKLKQEMEQKMQERLMKEMMEEDEEFNKWLDEQMELSILQQLYEKGERFC